LCDSFTVFDLIKKVIGVCDHKTIATLSAHIIIVVEGIIFVFLIYLIFAKFSSFSLFSFLAF